MDSLVHALLCALGSAVLIVPFLWAVGIISDCIVKQSRGAAFLRLGQLVYFVLGTGYHFDPDESIVPDHDPNTGAVTYGPRSIGRSWFIEQFFGLVLYLTGMVEPAKYSDFNDAGDGFGDGEFLVILHEQLVEVKLTKAETRFGVTGAEAVPLDLEMFFRMRPVNLRKFLTMSPKDVVSQVKKRMQSLFQGWVKEHTPAEIHAARASGKAGIWNAIYDAPMLNDKGQPVYDSAGNRMPGNGQLEIDDMEKAWGVEIVPNSIEIRDIGYQPADHEAQESSQRQGWLAKGLAKRMMGSVLELVAMRHSLPGGADEAQRLLDSTPDGKKFLDDMLAASSQIVLQTELGPAFKKLDLTGLGGGTGVDTLVARGAAIVQTLTQPPTPPPPPGP
jgi:hypothetical protein